jgi:hypothetical protein
MFITVCRQSGDVLEGRTWNQMPAAHAGIVWFFPENFPLIFRTFFISRTNQSVNI